MEIANLFKIRPVSTDEKEGYMITLGNHLATEKIFKTRKAAEMNIRKTDWNLVNALICATIEANEEIKKQENKNEKSE